MKREDIPLRDADRFWRTVQIGGADACWPWTGSVSHRGYGHCFVGGRPLRANRVAFVLSGGEFTEAKPFALHSCDNPKCCNPKHLRAGSHADNMADRAAKGRAAFGMKNGSHTHPSRRPTGDRNVARRVPGIRRGERNGRAKLNEAKVREIKRRLQAGEQMKPLGREFWVSDMSIRRIRDGIVWGWVTP